MPVFLFMFIFPTDLGYPAHLAAFAGDLDHLKSLIDKGISNINEQDEKGSTVAHKGKLNNCLQQLCM